MRPKGVADGQTVNIPSLPRFYTDGGTQKVKRESYRILFGRHKRVRQANPLNIKREDVLDAVRRQSRVATLPGKSSKVMKGTRTVNGHTWVRRIF